MIQINLCVPWCLKFERNVDSFAYRTLVLITTELNMHTHMYIRKIMHEYGHCLDTQLSLGGDGPDERNILLYKSLIMV
jgi:hypothetical protein